MRQLPLWTREKPWRISEALSVFVVVLLPVLCPAQSEETHLTGFSALSRPFVYRPDFLDAANAQKLRQFAAQGVAESGVSYTRAGFPVFTVTYQVDFAVPFRTWNYAAYANEKLLEQIQQNPLWAEQHGFAARDIELLKNGRNASGGYWHHDARNGRMQWVPYSEHESTPHVGGNVRWGAKSPPLAEMYRITALRWASVAGLDFALSMGINWYTGTLTGGVFIHEATGIAASWASASTVEYLATVYTGWGMGGPAAWAGTAAYIVTRFAIGSCWSAYEQHQFEIQEQLCRSAETKARWQNYLSAIQINDAQLLGD